MMILPKKLWRKPLDSKQIHLPKAEITIKPDLCKGCGFCIEFCPRKVLEESDQLNKRGVYPPRVADIDKCTICGFCTAICPDFAIFVKEKKCEEGCKDGEK
jgi:2-oxoglutarate ferredoxin oxidoreductase subunit delta